MQSDQQAAGPGLKFALTTCEGELRFLRHSEADRSTFTTEANQEERSQQKPAETLRGCGETHRKVRLNGNKPVLNRNRQGYKYLNSSLTGEQSQCHRNKNPTHVSGSEIEVEKRKSKKGQWSSEKEAPDGSKVGAGDGGGVGAGRGGGGGEEGQQSPDSQTQWCRVQCME